MAAPLQIQVSGTSLPEQALARVAAGWIDRQAVAQVGRAVAAVDELPDRLVFGQLECLLWISRAETALERPAAALRHAERGARLALIAGHTDLATAFWLAQGRAHGLLGRLGNAAACYDSAPDDLAAEAGRRWVRAWRGMPGRIGADAVALAGQHGTHEELAWLLTVTEPAARCLDLLLTLGGGAELPAVQPMARPAWYAALAAVEAVRPSCTPATTWAQKAQRSAYAVAADCGVPLRAGYGQLAWASALLADAPGEAAGWALMAARSFETAGDRLNRGWAHVMAASALRAAGRLGPAECESAQAQVLLDSCEPGLFEVARARAAPVSSASPVDTTAAPSPSLTQREQVVLGLLAQGLTAEAIGRTLDISPRTVHRHLGHLYRKLGTADRLTTVMRAQSLGLL